MKRYNLYIDTKQTVWTREYITVEAESEYEAIKKCLNDQIEPYDYDVLYSTFEPLDIEENDNQSTIEIYNKETKRCIYSNDKPLINENK